MNCSCQEKYNIDNERLLEMIRNKKNPKKKYEKPLSFNGKKADDVIRNFLKVDPKKIKELEKQEKDRK